MTLKELQYNSLAAGRQPTLSLPTRLVILITGMSVTLVLRGQTMVALTRTQALEPDMKPLPSRLCLIALLFAATPSMAWIEDWSYKGVPVAYQIQGTGSPVVQVHGIGAGASSEQTKYQVNALVEAGYRVYSIDLPGWGRSIGARRLFTGQFYASLIVAFIDEVVGDPSAIVAHSLGGTYAIAAAAARPELVTALVLNAPVGATSFFIEPSKESWERWIRLISGDNGQSLYKRLGSWASLGFFCRGSLYVDSNFCDIETLYDYRQFTRQPSSIYAAAAFLTGNLGLNVRQEFASLTQSVLLIWGAENVFTPVSEGDTFISLNPAASLSIIDHGGAMVNDEQSDIFNGLMLNQLNAAMP